MEVGVTVAPWWTLGNVIVTTLAAGQRELLATRRVELRDAVGHSSVHRMAPTAKTSPAPKYQ